MLLRGQDSINEVLRLSKDCGSIEKLNETSEGKDNIRYTKGKELENSGNGEPELTDSEEKSKDSELNKDNIKEESKQEDKSKSLGSLIKRGAEALATLGLIAVTTEELETWNRLCRQYV